jgi:aminobenzoyl-glutamate utilization protein B
MNVGANYLREHVPDGSRVQYYITNGGQAANIVLAAASVLYFVKSVTQPETDALLERLIKVAQGAAMMTETQVKWVISAAPYDSVPNLTLNRLMCSQAEFAGPLSFSNEEHEFAAKLRESLPEDVRAASDNGGIILDTAMHDSPADRGRASGASTDMGDISWIASMGWIFTTCAPEGVQFHTWQATSAFGSTVGMKGMHYAAKVLALSALDLFENRNGVLDKIKAEFAKSTKGAVYKAAIPDDVLPPTP